MASTVQIDFKVASQQAVTGLNRINKSVENVGKQVSTTRLAFANIIGGATIGAFRLFNQGISSIIGTMGEAIDLAKIQEDAINDLNIALRGTGKYSKEASEDLQRYASELQSTSIFGDEAILKAQALGIQMAKLSGQQLKDATLAAANMASAIGVDLNTAMRMLAKSAVDGGSGLKRYGVIVEKGSSAAETLANAIEATNTQFSGAALGKINTYGGAIQQTSNNFGDMQENLGQIITQSPAMISLIQTLSKIWVQLGIQIKENSSAIQAWIKDGIVLAIESLIALVPYINSTINAFKFMGNALLLTKDALVTGFWAMETAISSALLGIINIINKAVGVIPDSFIPDGWKENLLIAQEAIDATVVQMAEKTAESSESMVENFNAVGESFNNTISEEALNNITQRLNDVKTVVQKTSTAVIKDQVDKNKLKDKENKKDLKKQKSYYGGLAGFVGEFKSFEESSQKDRVSNMKSTLGSISTLTSSNNKTLFRIGQAAAISTATIDGIAGVQKALASAPPPFNFILAGLVGTAAALNVAKIASSKPPEFANGGIVGGNSYSGDSVPAFVNSGEMVLNLGQQKELFNMANGSGNNDALLEAINNLGNRIENMEIVLQTSDYEIGRSVNRAVDDGLALSNG